MRVLVVEDHPRLATTVATVLRREGMAVDVAFDGPDALAHAAATGYDVIVLDRNLPRLHGDEVCRALLAGGCQTRILMLTAHLPASGDRDISQERFDGHQEPAAS